MTVTSATNESQTIHGQLQKSHKWLQVNVRQLQTACFVLCNLSKSERYRSDCQYSNQHFPVDSQQEKRKKKSVKYVQRYYGPNICNSLPFHVMTSENLKLSKTLLKTEMVLHLTVVCVRVNLN